MKKVSILKFILISSTAIFILVGCGGADIVNINAGENYTNSSNSGGIIGGDTSGDFIPSFRIDSDDENGLDLYMEGVPLTFIDTSTEGSLSVESISWDFGDGTTSTVSPVEHTYNSKGRYKAILTIYNGDVEKKVSLFVDVYGSATNEPVDPNDPDSLAVNFEIDSSTIIVTGSPTDEVSDDTTVTFTYTGQEGVSKLVWDFGDDTSSTTESSSIQHTYTVSFDPVETYTVTLKGIDDSTKDIYEVSKQFQFIFEQSNIGGIYSPSASSAHYAAALADDLLTADKYFLAITKDTDTSKLGLFDLSKTIRTQLADFTDNYEISLTQEEKALFQDTSTYSTEAGDDNIPEDAIFNFGDGTIIRASEDTANCIVASIANPNAYPVCEHFYANAGDYTVTVISTYGSLGKRYTQDIKVTGHPILVDFTNDAGHIVAQGSTISFEDISVISNIDIEERVWEFGDNSTPITTTSPSIQYQFNTSGDYNITLTLNALTGETGTVTKKLIVKQLETLEKIRVDFSPLTALLNTPVVLISDIVTTDIVDLDFVGYWKYRGDENLDENPTVTDVSALLDSPPITFTTRGEHAVTHTVANDMYVKSGEKNVIVVENEDNFGNNSGGLISPRLLSSKDTIYLGDNGTTEFIFKKVTYNFSTTTSVNPIIKYVWTITGEDGVVLERDSDGELLEISHTFEVLGEYDVQVCVVDSTYLRDCANIKTYVVNDTGIDVDFTFDENPFNRTVGSPQTISLNAVITANPLEQPNVKIFKYEWELENRYINRDLVELDTGEETSMEYSFPEEDDRGKYLVTSKITLSTGQIKEISMPAEQIFTIYGENENFFDIDLEILGTGLAKVNKGIGFGVEELVPPAKGDIWRWQVDVGDGEPFIQDYSTIVVTYPNNGGAENIGEHAIVVEGIDNTSYYYAIDPNFTFDVYMDSESDITDLSINIVKLSAGGDFTATGIGFLDYAPEIDVNNGECLNYQFKANTVSNSIDKYIWYFGNGDNATTTVNTVEYEYCTPETYRPKLLVIDADGRSTSASTLLGINHTVTSESKCPINLLTRLQNPYYKLGVGQVILLYESIKYSCGYEKYQFTWGAHDTHGDPVTFTPYTDFYDLKLNAIDTGGNYAYSRHRYSAGGTGGDLKSVDPAPKGFFIPYQNYLVRDPAPSNTISNQGILRSTGTEWRWYTSVEGYWGFNNTTFAPIVSGDYWITSDYYHPPSTGTLGYQEAGSTSVTIYPALIFCSIGKGLSAPKVEVYNFSSKDASGLLNHGYSLDFTGEAQGDDCTVWTDSNFVYYQHPTGEGKASYDGTNEAPEGTRNLTKLIQLEDIEYREIDVTPGYISFGNSSYLTNYKVISVVYFPIYNEYIIEVYDDEKDEVSLYTGSWEDIVNGNIKKLPFDAFTGLNFENENSAYIGNNILVNNDDKIIIGLPTGTFVLEILDSFSVRKIADINMVGYIKLDEGYLMLVKNNENDNYPTKIIRTDGDVSNDINDVNRATLDSLDTYLDGTTGEYDGTNQGISGLLHYR